MKNYYLVLFAIFVFLAGCTTNSVTPASQTTTTANTTTSPIAENKAVTTPANTTPLAAAISIETFTEFPPEIDGCSCYLSANKSDFDAQKYIYADNYQDTGFMKINGAMVKFEKVDEKEVSRDHWIKKFDSKEYAIVLDITKSGKVGPFLQKGTISLTRKKGETIIKDFTGECGC
ncbi:MAG: hypothetical protein JNM09_30860 [Blastocatellia bacterium]|nr:hypothetical protein [Blastocatellia bacterium]